MINLTKFFSRTLQQFQSSPLPCQEGPLLSPWKTKPSVFVKHSPIMKKRQIRNPLKKAKETSNPEATPPSAQPSPQPLRKLSYKSIKTCPSLDCKERIHPRPPKKIMSSSKLPLLLPLKQIRMTLKKGQAKGNLHQFLQSKCKENSRQDNKSLTRITNQYRINQLKDSLFQRKNELIKSRAIRLK